MNQLTLECHPSMQSLPLRRNNSFSSSTSASGSTISAPAMTGLTSNSVHVKPLGAIASPVNPQSSSPMQVAFEEYLLVPTSDGRLLVYQINDFEHAEMILLEEEMSSFQSTSSLSSSHNNSQVLNAGNTMNITGNTPTNIKVISSKVHKEKFNQLPIETIGPLYSGEYTSINIGSNESSQLPLNVRSSAVIVGLASVGTMDDTFMLGHVALMTAQGDVFVFEFQKSLEDGSLQVKPFCAFGCDRISGQCIAMRRKNRSELCVVCGFLDGTIQEYEIKKNEKTLCLEGFLNRLPITCLSYITSFSSARSNQLDTDSAIQLVVGMSEREIHSMGRSSTENIIATCLEVVSVQVAKNIWQLKQNASIAPSKLSVSLIECSVWPLHETIHLTKTKRSSSPLHERKISQKASHEPHHLICSIVTKRSSFSVAISNGAIATFNFWINDEERFCWGLESSKTQRVLPYPTWNLGILNDCMASCSRDASVLIWPCCSKNESQKDRVISLLVPYEPIGFDDDLLRYTIGFCAGNARTKMWGVHRDSTTKYVHMHVLAIAWAGGVIECYTVDFPSRFSLKDEFDVVMKRIADEGILSDVFSILKSYAAIPKPLQDEDSLIYKASNEYIAWEHGDEELISCLLNKKPDGISAIKHFIVDLIRSR